jgi:hypothetical protein
MTEPAAGGREPDERDGTGHAGAWSAATDPVGAQPGRDLPGEDRPDGTEPDSGQPAGQQPGGAPADGSQPGGSQPGSREVRGREAGGVSAIGRGAGRETGRAVDRPARSRRPESRRPDASGGDLLTDLQRWLIRSGARSMRHEIEGKVRRSLGGGRAQPGDVWGTATTEPPPDAGQSPECLWCPICRAARRMRESGPGLGSQLSGASDVVAAAVQDAIVTLDTVLSRTAAAPGQERPADRSPASGHADSANGEAERAADEPGDRG